MAGDPPGRGSPCFEAEAKYVALVEQIPGVVYLDPVDEALDSLFVSPQVRDLLGVEPEDWIANRNCWSSHVHPDDFVRAWDEHMHLYTRDVPMNHEYRMVHEDGTVKWVLELAGPIHDEHGDPWMIQGVIFDITERREAEEAQAERGERLSRIIETQRDIAAADLDLHGVMQLICERTQELTNGGSASILLLDGEDLEVRVATGFMVASTGRRIPIEGSLAGWVFSHDRSVIVDDVQTDPRFGSFAGPLGMRSIIIVPLRHGNATPGELTVASLDPAAFTEHDLNMLELLSAVLSSAISHASEFESKRQQVDALARFETIYQGAAIGITLVTPQGEFLDANRAFELMFGYTAYELRSETLSNGRRPSDLARSDELFREMMAGTRDTYAQEKRFYRKDGELVWGHVTAALQRDAEGNPQYSISMIEDITERKEAEEKLAYLAYHDELTGLVNRSRFMEALEASIDAARRHGLAVAVIFMDLDNFKLVNDSLGHVAGDQLLVQLADRLRGLKRGSDLVGRQSGDEFLLLVSDAAGGSATSPGNGAALHVFEERARRVHELFKEPFTLEGVDFTISASLGISVFPSDATDAKSLLSHADVAMYRSKAIGPGGTVVYSTDRENPMRRLRLATQLRQAVER